MVRGRAGGREGRAGGREDSIGICVSFFYRGLGRRNETLFL